MTELVEAQTLKNRDRVVVNGWHGIVRGSYKRGSALWVFYPDARNGKGQTIGEIVSPDALIEKEAGDE